VRRSRSGLLSRSPRVVWSDGDAIIIAHLRQYAALYLFALALLCAGVVLGAMTAGSLHPEQVDELAEYTLGFFQSLEGRERPLSGRDIFLNSLATNMKSLAVIFLLGFTVVGMPVIAVVILLRGFVIGFTVSFLIYIKGTMGVGLALISVLPQNLFLLTSLLLCAVNAVGYSLQLLVRKKDGAFPGRSSVLLYVVRGLIAVVITLLGVATESYLVPVGMRLLAPYL